MTLAARPRREQLLEAAADLFSRRGFHAVGIDDIGAAAGISGPGVYRHFASKQALLEVLCDRAMDSMLGSVQAAAQDGGLDAVLDLHVRFAVEQRALLGVWWREARALSDDVRRSLRARQKAYELIWGGVLAPLRTDLSPDEVAMTVTAVLALLNSTALSGTAVPDRRLRELLARMARSALLARPA